MDKWLLVLAVLIGVVVGAAGVLYFITHKLQRWG